MSDNHKANLFVVSAPSGAGKTSLVRALVTKASDITISVSHTTRAPRPNDHEGKDYFFINKLRFQQMIAAKEFLEHAAIYGHHYGTEKAWVMEQLRIGNDVVLEIDWQGARQIRQLFPPALLIFILPPSAAVLRQRLIARGQDDIEVIEKRLSLAQQEMAHYREFDYLVVNDDFDHAVLDLVSIVHAERLQTNVQQQKLRSVLAELTKKQ